MASINYAAREISVKIVYYGPGLSGKTTNLQIIHRKIPPDHKSDMVSLATETDRTLFFDFLPLDLGTIKGFSTKFQLYTVPGQVYYNATRKLVLRGVDGVVFVADSAADKIPENLESFQNLEDNLAEYHYKREEVPIIIQYNKRDLPNALSIEELQQQINKYNVPWTEAVANKGIGVFDSLKLMGKIVIDSLNRKYSRLSRGAASSARASGSAAVPQAPQPGSAPLYPPQSQETIQPRQQTYQQPYSAPMQQGYGNAPTVPYQQQTMSQPPRRPPVSQPAMQQQQSFSIPGGTYPAQAAPQQFATPNVERYAPISRQQPITPVPPMPSQESQQQYGFVNFESLPIEPMTSKPAVEPVPQSGYSTSQNSGVKTDSAIPVPSSIGHPAQPVQQQPPPAAGTEQEQPGKGHTVIFPQKQRPARTQIDERDYSVYHIDSSQQPFQQSSSSSDTDQLDDTDIRMQEKLNAPPGKQQKGFLSKFFNRDEQ
jgi:signal recognition particle receptor subunit beta